VSRSLPDTLPLAPGSPGPGRARRILLSAYACGPDRGSEPGIGWNWSRALADLGHDVTVLTQPTMAAAISARLEEPRANQPRFVYVATPAWAKKVPGQIGVYVHYLAWQWAAYQRARRLVATGGFDLVHHVTFGSLTLGSFLGLLPIPLVFGPAGGAQTVPRSLRRYLEGSWGAEVIRRIITQTLIAIVPTARLAVRRARLVLAANEETEQVIRRLGARATVAMPDMGVGSEEIAVTPPPRPQDRALRVLWVGRLMPRKALPLALDAIASVSPDVSVHLRIVGYGRQSDLVPGWIERSGVEHRAENVGRLEWTAMDQEYRDADVLLFTSLRDSGGIQMLEALARGCPVVALDHQGARVLLTEEAGIRVPITDAKGTARALGAALERLASDPQQLSGLAEGALRLAREHTWEGKAKQATLLYDRVVEAV
jgi:glycosyltransferase involved in cell wall biosynthesis